MGDDQYGLNACIMEHADWITIDYSSSLSLQLADMHTNVANHWEDVVQNNVVRATQCFIHGNGRSLPRFWNRLFPGRTRLQFNDSECKQAEKEDGEGGSHAGPRLLMRCSSTPTSSSSNSSSPGKNAESQA